MTKTLMRFLGTVMIFTLCISMANFCCAEGSGMSWAYPQPEDDLHYRWELEKNVSEVDFSDAAMYLSFDVSDSGKQHLIKAEWLPQVDENEEEKLLNMDKSFYDELHFQTEYLAESDLYGHSIDELLELSGLSEAEAAEEWYTSIQLQTSNTYPYRIDIYDNFRLYGHDLILGAYGAEALSVDEGEINGMQMLKAVIDYTKIYSDREIDEESWKLIEKSLIKNYIFLFNSDGEYMISVSGTNGMDTLLKIAENIKVRETELVRTYYDDGIDYIFHDMGKG